MLLKTALLTITPGLFFAALLVAAPATVEPPAAAAAAAVHVEQLAKTSESWNGSSLPAYPTGTPEVTILRITIPPHTSLPVHKHPVINAGVLLEGELTVVSEKNETIHMKAGDSLVELVNQWHRGINEGDVPAVILVVYAGAKGTPITVLRSAAESE